MAAWSMDGHLGTNTSKSGWLEYLLPLTMPSSPTSWPFMAVSSLALLRAQISCWAALMGLYTTRCSSQKVALPSQPSFLWNWRAIMVVAPISFSRSTPTTRSNGATGVVATTWANSAASSREPSLNRATCGPGCLSPSTPCHLLLLGRLWTRGLPEADQRPQRRQQLGSGLPPAASKPRLQQQPQWTQQQHHHQQQQQQALCHHQRVNRLPRGVEEAAEAAAAAVAAARAALAALTLGAASATARLLHRVPGILKGLRGRLLMPLMLVLLVPAAAAAAAPAATTTTTSSTSNLPITFATLNTNKLSTLAGLPNLLPSFPSPPSVIFLQECTLPDRRLGPLAASLGYDAFIGQATDRPAGRKLVSLVRRPLAATAADLAPGYLQHLQVGDVAFIHVHLPSANDTQLRGRLVANILRPHMAAAAAANTLPIIIGDFNCVFLPTDAQLNFEHKTFPALRNLLQQHNYDDIFHNLHPHHPHPFTFHRPGSTATRLDRAHVPPLMAGSIRQAVHLATTSDHHAAFFKLAGHLATPQEDLVAKPESFWHLNTTILQEPTFSPEFARFWAALLAGHPPALATDAADWWEEVAKPACRHFCQQFSKLLAHRRRETAYILRVALQSALMAGNWPTVAVLKSRMKEDDNYRKQGAFIRSRQPFVPGEEEDVFMANVEANRPHVATTRVRTPWPTDPSHPPSRILTDTDDIEREIITYFDALFNGRHVATPDCPEPVDSGHPFVPDFSNYAAFTDNLPQLTPRERDTLATPFQMLELTTALEATPPGKSPGLDGLPYEFYKATHQLTGPHLLAAFTAALQRGHLPATMRRGAVRLIPKVAGVPMASQFRPITLLCTDYKLLTKILCQRLLPLLPSVLATAQLCSVQGKSIFDGILAILSTAEELRRRREPGFLLNLDLFHAYDRVCLPFLDRVLDTMNFGHQFRSWVATLHRGATATFLLSRHSQPIPILFSVRQGDPLAMLLFLIQIEPLLATLTSSLPAISVGAAMESTLAYVDDVDVLGQSDEDLLLANNICLQFEAMSGAILNRNRKSAIIGLGAWAGRQDWPLPWLDSPPTLKVFGVHFAATLQGTTLATWEAAISRFRAAIIPWQHRGLATLRSRRDALETFLFSKLYYLAQAIPMPAEVARAITAAAGAFLWGGAGFGAERVAWEVLHNPLTSGGLAITDIASRAEALIIKQSCWMAGQGGRSAAHLAYWHGQSLHHLYPQLQPPPHLPRRMPGFMTSVATLLEEVAITGVVDTAALTAVTAKAVYADFLATPPPPRIEDKWPDIEWPLAWPRVWSPGLLATESDLLFRLLHNVLPVRARMARLNPGMANGHCPHCPGQLEDTDHLFITCIRVADLWLNLFFNIQQVFPSIPTNSELLRLAFAPCGRDADVVATVASYVSLVWATRNLDTPPLWPDLLAALRDRPSSFRPLWRLRLPGQMAG